MKTIFPKSEFHCPKYFIINAENKTLGYLAVKASQLLRGKIISYYTPGIDQGNYVIIINAFNIIISNKKKEVQKVYYHTSQRPGNLKQETFKHLKNRISIRILEKAIFGMLPKGVLGRKYYKRLFIYPNNKINFNI
jgi:large subunit ribosomal protein L13